MSREMNGLSDFFTQAAVRKAGTSVTAPKLTKPLDELAKANQLNLLDEKDRAKLAEQLTNVQSKAPNLHISFAVEPPPKALEKILSWMRENLDPQILLQVGLQPNIGAGCVLRTANREIDMSMRQHLIDSQKHLVELIAVAAQKAALVLAAAPTAPAPAAPETAAAPVSIVPAPAPPTSNPVPPNPEGVANG